MALCSLIVLMCHYKSTNSLSHTLHCETTDTRGMPVYFPLHLPEE